MLKEKGGIALFVVLVLMVVLLVLGGALLSRSISENRLAERHARSMRAFWLAEAGVDRALEELRVNYNAWSGATNSITLGNGQYRVCSVVQQGSNWIVTAIGGVPLVATNAVIRGIEAEVYKDTPPNGAFYTPKNFGSNGDAYVVEGDGFAGSTSGNTNNVTGTISLVVPGTGLPALDYEKLRQMSITQGYYTDGDLKITPTTEGLPPSFWQDESAGIPNIIYINGSLTTKGNIPAIGGIFVVVGDVITDPDVTEDSIMSGNGEIQGVIYVRGEFIINGGGQGLNVTGGVWAGEDITLNGKATIEYNADYVVEMAFFVRPGLGFWREKEDLSGLL